MLRENVEVALRALLRANTALGYADLCQIVDPTMNARDPKLHGVLGEILVDNLRDRVRPLPALIYNRKLERPGDGFFEVLRRFDPTVGTTPAEMRSVWESLLEEMNVRHFP
jgi:hypothetical protein